MPDEIIVSVNGTNYGGWKSAQATRSIDAVCGSFAVDLMDKWDINSQPLEIRPGDACQVLIGDEPVITGHIDSVSPAISGSDHSVNVSGRDKTADLVDCSAEVETYETIGLTLAGLAEIICGKFPGIAVRIETDVGKPFNRFAIQPGETAFACLDRAAKMRGVLLTTDGDGNLVLSARGVFEETGDALVEGENILSGSAVYDWKDRFQTYRVNSQMPSFGDGADDPLHAEIGEARDANVMRHRPLIVNSEAWATPEATRTRAENECCSRAGKSVRVNIQVVGWRQSSGALWKPGLKVSVTSPALYRLDNADLVISTVRYTYSDGSGTVAELELTPPDAYLDAGEGEVKEDPFGL